MASFNICYWTKDYLKKKYFKFVQSNKFYFHQLISQLKFPAFPNFIQTIKSLVNGDILRNFVLNIGSGNSRSL